MVKPQNNFVDYDGTIDLPSSGEWIFLYQRG